jgi:hypothetical protein
MVGCGRVIAPPPRLGDGDAPAALAEVTAGALGGDDKRLHDDAPDLNSSTKAEVSAA